MCTHAAAVVGHDHDEVIPWVLIISVGCPKPLWSCLVSVWLYNIFSHLNPPTSIAEILVREARLKLPLPKEINFVGPNLGTFELLVQIGFGTNYT